MTYKQSFDFDRFGNMYRKAASNNPTGQENPLPYTPIEDGDISKSTNRFATGTTYDDAGNVVTDNIFRSMTFGYDANGRMVKASRAQVPDALSVYDASGLRVAEKVNDVWRFLIYDIGGKLVAEYGAPAEGAAGVKYVLQDWQGSVRAVANSNGHVVARTDHQAFSEEIGVGVGMRKVEQGYSADRVARQGYGLTENDESSGQQHTWFRKLETQAGRWTSPDPYKGSMNIGDPQSFNRYAYVSGDPANFIDPSGLMSCNTVFRTFWVNGLYDSSGFYVECTDQQPFTTDTSRCPGGVCGGGVISTVSHAKSNQTDCERFASEVEKIRNEHPYMTASRFVKKLYKRFANSGREFGDGGFKKQFRDRSNQARHYVGGLWAGFLGGSTLGEFVANRREDNLLWVNLGTFKIPVVLPDTPAGRADKALNAVSTKHGSDLDSEKIKPFQLADLIRKEVCE